MNCTEMIGTLIVSQRSSSREPSAARTVAVALLGLAGSVFSRKVQTPGAGTGPAAAAGAVWPPRASAKRKLIIIVLACFRPPPRRRSQRDVVVLLPRVLKLL